MDSPLDLGNMGRGEDGVRHALFSVLAHHCEPFPPTPRTAVPKKLLALVELRTCGLWHAVGWCLDSVGCGYSGESSR